MVESLRPISADPSPATSADTDAAARRGLIALRLALGGVWTLNLLYIVDPANQFFSQFAATAGGFGPSTAGGPSFADFVAAHPTIFSILIAVVTVYLAAAFLMGWRIRVACVIGAVFNSVLLVTQFSGISTVPGATDVGPQPLYLVSYLALFVGYTRHPIVAWAELSALFARARRARSG